jgi:UDP-glucose 4-epimerase
VGGEIFQLASGVETSLNDLVAMLAEVSGTQPRLQHEPPRAGEIQRNYSLVDKARDRLGHAPQVPLAEGLARTWEWFQDQTEG